MLEEKFTGSAKVNDRCSKCLICVSTCPYEAISIKFESEQVAEVKIDPEKCQVCGICASACPVSAIDIAYYDDDALIEYVKTQMDEKHFTTLALMCRGNSPQSCEVGSLLKEQKYIPLRLPCTGRISSEFILRALTLGIDKIIVLRCEEDFCRFKKGSMTNSRRLRLTSSAIKSFGYDEDTLISIEHSHKTVYDTDKCVGGSAVCGKCVFICPYEAIESAAWGTPEVDLDKCTGCGACALVCPTQAMQLDSFEYEPTSNLIERYGKAAKELKAKGMPAILAFCCQWCEFPALDSAQSQANGKTMVMEIPCFKGLDPVHVISAFYYGFDGVLAFVCSSDDCKLEKGREIAERNADVIKNTLKKLNLADRFEICEVSPRSKVDFDSKVASFAKKITVRGMAEGQRG